MSKVEVTIDNDFVKSDLSVSDVIIDTSPPSPDLEDTNETLGLAPVPDPSVLGGGGLDEDCVEDDWTLTGAGDGEVLLMLTAGLEVIVMGSSAIVTEVTGTAVCLVTENASSSTILSAASTLRAGSSLLVS